MSEELEVLKEVTRRLDHARISYMVTGSMATNFYTVPRMTRDIDIVVELAEEDLGRFIPLFDTDFYLEPQTVRDAVKHRGMFNLIQNEHIVKIDFMVRKDSPYRRREFSRRKRVAVDDRNLYLVAPEDLILSKLEWAKESRSEMQLSDVRNLLNSIAAQPALFDPLGKGIGRRIALPRGEQVKDTAPAVERKFRQMLLKRSGEKRLKMGCSMHATARALAVASLLQKHPGSHAAELKRLLFLQFYGADFAPKERKRIISALSKTGTSSKAPSARVREVSPPAEEKRRAQIAEPPLGHRTKHSVNKKK